jgi:hypothetical protein
MDTPYDIDDTIRLGAPHNIDATVRLGAPYDISLVPKTVKIKNMQLNLSTLWHQY